MAAVVCILILLLLSLLHKEDDDDAHMPLAYKQKQQRRLKARPWC
jgi:hypothetical protein